MIFEENVPNELLRRARHLKGWTQSELAESIGTDFETVSRWERGITVPSAYFRAQLCTALEKTPQELGLIVDPEAAPPRATSSGVFLAASYADTEGKFVTDLKAHLQMRDIPVFSPRSLRRQGAEHQRKAWQEALHTAQAVLLIVSPEARSSRHVQKALQMAMIYKRPLCTVWVEGASWQECAPSNCGGLFACIDARKNDGHSVFDEIFAQLEQIRLASNETAVSPVENNEAQVWARRNTSSGSEVTSLLASVTHQRRSRFGLAAFCILAVFLLFFTAFVNRQLLFPPDPTLVTNFADNGPGSLRQAIDMVQPGGVITFDPHMKGVIKLTGNLSINKDLSIRGPGAEKLSITGDGSFSAIIVKQKITSTISGLAFKGTNQTEAGVGVIYNDGTLTLANSIVSGNATLDGGGAITNYGKLTIKNSIIANNTTSYGWGGGIGNYGGSVTINNSRISGNIASAGGGIVNNGGALILSNSVVSNNTAYPQGYGGGIHNVNGGILTLTNSTVSGNRAVYGGGINNGYSYGDHDYNDLFNQGGPITLTNSTISDNTAAYGAGILANAGSPANITFSTIYGNVAQKTGGGIAIVAYTSHQSSLVKIKNSIVAGNSANMGPGIVGTLTSGGYNLIQNVSDATFATSQQHHTDISVDRHADLKIDSALSGKQPQVHALLTGSPAIDRIPLSACYVNGISTDERGVKRPDSQEQFCDIGAYEYMDIYV